MKVEILSNQITDATAPDRVATIRYKKIIRRLADNSTRNEYWDARFTFHSNPDKEMSDAEREINYFGFTVTSWQTDREIREVNDEKLTFTALALMMCGAAWAAAIPQASRYDSRVQQVIYNPQNVTVVNTKPGFMTTLVFDNDEAVISAKL